MNKHLVSLGCLFFSLPALAADDFCSPYGDPIPSSLAGSNAFVVCQVGDTINTSWGQVTQYLIRCKPNTLRSNWKWVLYCNGGGTSCDCNRNSMISNPRATTQGAWKAGDHCTSPGDGRPRENGCDGW